MTPEENKELIRRGIEEVTNQRKLNLAPEYFAPDFKRHDLGRLFPDRAGAGGVRDHISMILTAMPDMRLDVHEILADGDKVAVWYTLRGTHTGEFLGVRGTGGQVAVAGINIYRVVDGKVVETWQLSDGLGLLRQLGASLDALP